MTYISRSLEKHFLNLSGEYGAVLITGPRQVGKTTMLQKLMEEEGNGRSYVTLDDLNDRELAKTDPALFFQLHPPPVLIDEIQYAPELFPYIKMQVDESKETGRFWLTGSQLFKLMAGVQESLAGRVALLHLSPLSQQELYPSAPAEPFTVNLEKLAQRQDKIPPVSMQDIYTRIFNGGMPALASGKVSDRNVFYSSYISTYINRDVRDLSGDIDTLKFMNFITAVAARASELINYASIAEEASISQVMAKDWINILETLGIIFVLHPYSNNVLKRTIKTPKVYFYDTGLVCYLTRWSSAETAMTGAMNGALLENYAVSEVLKSYQNQALEPYMYYYRDRDKKEIDIVIERDGVVTPIEIKRTASPNRGMIRSFSVLDRVDLMKGTGAVLCMAEKLGAIDSDNLIVPIGLI